MPIKSPGMPAGAERAISERAWTVKGPSKKLRTLNSEDRLVKHMNDDLFTVGQLLRPAVVTGKEISLVGQASLQVMDKLQNGTAPTAQEVGVTYLALKEMMAGMRDPNSVYFVEADQQSRIETRLKRLAAEASDFLTGNEKWGIDVRNRIWETPLFNKTLGGGSIDTNSEKNLRPERSLKTTKDKIARKMGAATDFNDLDPAKKPQCETMAYEEVMAIEANTMAVNILKQVGKNADANTISQAIASKDPSRIRVGQLARDTADIRARVFTQGDNIRQMTNMTEFLNFLGIKQEPNQILAITGSDVVETIVRYKGLNQADADALRADQNLAITTYMATDIIGTSVMIGDLLRNKLDTLAAAGKGSTNVEKLNNLVVPELSVAAKGALTGKDAAFVLMCRGGDFVDQAAAEAAVATAFRFTPAEAARVTALVTDALAAGNGAVNNGGRIQVQSDNMTEWATKEMMVEAVRRNVKKGMPPAGTPISMNDIKDQIRATIVATGAYGADPTDPAYDTARDQEFTNSFQPYFDYQSADLGTRVAALKRFSVQQKGLIGSLGGMGIVKQMELNMDDKDQDAFAQQFKL